MAGDAKSDSAPSDDAPEHADISIDAQECKALGWSTGKAVRHLVARHGVSVSTAYRHLAKVAEAWAAVVEDARPFAKARQRARIDRGLEGASTDGQWNAYAALLKQSADLDGLNEPSEFRDRTEKVVDLSKLTDDELATHVRLMRKASGEPAPEE